MKLTDIITLLSEKVENKYKLMFENWDLLDDEFRRKNMYYRSVFRNPTKKTNVSMAKKIELIDSSNIVNILKNK